MVICHGFSLVTNVLIVNHFGQKRLLNALNVNVNVSVNVNVKHLNTKCQFPHNVDLR